jgi:hypothetical protein
MFYVLGLVLLVAGFWLLVFGSRLYGQPKVGEQISHWQDKLPLPSEPPQRFYQRLYQAFKASLQDRLADGDNAAIEVVLTGMGFGPHRLFAAPSLFAERPLYLLVRYKHLRCYIYAGQTPTGLFISAWGYSDYQAGEGDLQRLLPIMRALKYFKRQTLFQYDAAIMFTTSVHEILYETLNACLLEKGLKPLEEMEKRPILHAFYQNPFYRDRGFFGQGGNDHYRQADLFGESSRTATPTAPPNHAESNSNNTNHASPVSTAPPSAVSPVSTTPATAATPPPSSPPQPQPLFPMDEWLTDERAKDSKNIDDAEKGKAT